MTPADHGRAAFPGQDHPSQRPIEVTVTGPRASLRELVAKHGLLPTPGGPDPVNAWTATLQQIAASNGGVLPIPTFTRTVTLHDDGVYNDGAMEPVGIYANTVKGITPFSKAPTTFTRYLTTVPTAQRASRPSGRSPLG